MTAPFADFDLHETWKLTSDEINALRNKSGATRLGFAVLLKFFQAVGRFPCDAQEVPRHAVEDLARQVGVPPAAWYRYDLRRRAVAYHRAEIRAALGFREATVADGEELGAWLLEHVEYAPGDGQLARVTAAAYERCRALRLEPPTPERLERLVRSVMRTQDERFAVATAAQLTAETRALLDALILEVPFLRSGPGSATLESIQAEVKKLESLRALHIPEALFRGVSGSVLRAHRQCVAVQESFELRRHPEVIRMTQMAAFCHLRSREVTDTLVELLLESIHKIGTKAERKVTRELIADLKRVNGKEGLLFRVAEASLAKPEGAVKDVVFPVVSEQTLRDLVREAKASGRAFRVKVQIIKRNSYRSHYRRMVPLVLRALEFRSNNEIHQPVIKALGLLRKYLDSKDQFYSSEEDVPVEGVVRKALRDTVCETDVESRSRIRRIDYEMCVLGALREKLRCKEIWVVGADRYRNPDEDLPQDFDQKREDYYAKLKVPRAAKTFTDQLRREMAEELGALEHDIPTNRYVEILGKKGGWIKLSPLPAQAEPKNLDALKGEIMRRWSITTLLDILKETDMRVGFTDVFRSATARENMNRDVLQPRLLLSLFGLGTNAGLKRVCAGQDAATYKDLLYVRRRFITTAHMREVIRRVANAIFDVRQTTIWGEGTTACASDSKKFGAYDQNLMTEYHARYRGAGIMIYWHVEKKAVCVYGQLKTCSSSETASMIQGVLRHCTTMQIDKNYVDTHGQSEVAFAFCRLLGFQLLPRIKAIHRQRLYRAESGRADAYPNLQLVLTRPINWEMIEQQYDEMIKYTTALREGTADAESILRRFTRANVQHPTYSALAELGRAHRTVFLCRYLRLEALRREIEEGLNVVENWNSANGFIFYGKGGDFASNDQDDQECSMLCLHLLQICLVYINTLMIQQVLAAPAWMQRMEPEDMRGLTPLIYSHVTPYGSFRLDMSTRLMIDGSEATPAPTWPSAPAAYAG
ncbi:MAG: Tn3 family transposase [Deltaproteobacteria bacterium]|nr:Tn3 family transposase [Deltaproteobacteria bacterium]